MIPRGWSDARSGCSQSSCLPLRLAKSRSGMALTGRALLLVLTIVLGTTNAYGAQSLGFGGVSLGATEIELHNAFPDVDCRGDRCFVDALAWGGLPTRAAFIFGDDRSRSIKSILLAFKSELYAQVLPRLVIEFGQPTEQRGASFLWKMGKSGVVLNNLGKGQDFHVFITADVASLKPR
jgi:hypothetical protein